MRFDTISIKTLKRIIERIDNANNQLSVFA